MGIVCRRTVVAVVLLAVVSAPFAASVLAVSPATAAGVADLPAGDDPASAQPASVTTLADRQPGGVEISKQLGRLIVVIPNETANYTVGAPIRITVQQNGGNGTAVYQNVTGTLEPTDNQTRYRIVRERLPDEFNLAGAQVTVRANGTRLAADRLNLNYAAVADARLTPNGSLVLTNRSDTVGFGTSAITLVVRTGDGRITVEATRGPANTFRVPRSALTQLFLPPTNATIVDVRDDGVRLPSNQTVDVRTLAANTSVTTADGRIRVAGPLLLADQPYEVVVETADGRYETAVNATSGTAGGVVTVSNEQATRAPQLTVTVYYDTGDGRTAVVTRNVTTAGVPSIGLLNNRTLDVSALAIGNASVASLRVIGNDSVTTQNLTLSGGTLQLGTTRLAGDGRYELLVRLSDGRVLSAVIPAGGATGVGSVQDRAGASRQAGGPTDGLLAGGGILVFVGAVALAVTAAGAVLFVQRRRSNDEPGPFDVTVTVTTGLGSRYEGTVEIVGTQTPNDPASTPEQLARFSGGEGAVRLPTGGRWYLTARTNGFEGTEEITPRGDRQNTLGIPLAPQQATVRFVDAVSGEPIPDVTATLSLSDDQRDLTERSNGRGEVQFEVPPTVGAMELTTSHAVYEDTSRRIQDVDSLGGEVTLAEETGDLRVETLVDGEPTPGVAVTTTPVDGTPGDERQATSDEAGVVELSGLIVGQYRVTSTVEGAAFTDDTTTVEISDSEETRATLDVRFELSMATHRDGLDRLASATEELRPPDQIDGAIHHYYGTVFESLAETIRGLEAEGHRFARSELDADEVVAAATETGVSLLEATDDALNSKHNVDLFSACSHMPADRPRWEGSFDVDQLFESADRPRGELDTALRSRIDETDGRLADRRQEVTDVTPAREPFDATQAYVRDQRIATTERQLATMLVVEGYLAAIEAMFDDQRVLDRLDTTVY